MRIIALGPHSDPKPLAPSPLCQFFYLLLAAEEFALTIFRVQQEALEVAEAIEDQPRDLVCGRFALFHPLVLLPLALRIARRRWWNLARISAEPLHACADLIEVATEDRIPAVV